MSEKPLQSIFDSRTGARLAIFVFATAAAFLALCFFTPQTVSAHQQPTTLVTLDVNPDSVSMKLEIPLSELELAFGSDVTKNTDTLVARLAPALGNYLKAHIRPVTDNRPWTVEVADLKVEEAEQTQSETYQEITVHLDLVPPAGVETRRFTLNYDVIMHQVVTHRALVSIRNDWAAGSVRETPVEAGVIHVDTATAQIFPLEINLEKGGAWQGFKGMVTLGMAHIREGTDHLLFLLVLLLPAPLLCKDKVWDGFGGTKYSLARLLKIVTAFTLGHSVTLLVGAFGWLQLPPQPVEILIAFSILVSAVHAVRPIFPGRETYVAAGFGLVHGLAFATVLAELKLGVGQMALSILGFNIGIELMQIFVIALIVPWLILLSLTPVYKWVRIAGALLAALAAAAWILERVSGTPNHLSGALEHVPEYAHFGILTIALIALAAYAFHAAAQKNASFEHSETEGE